MTALEIIAIIVKLFGPFLQDAISKWLSGLLNKSVAAVYASPNAGQTVKFKTIDEPTMREFCADVFDEALRATPRTRPFRRAILRHLRDAAPAAIVANRVPKTEGVELRALAAQAE